MRIFGSDRMDSVLRTLGLQEGEAIIHPWMNKSLEMAQKKVEARNFDIRKQILKYDDVMNDQRKVIFDQRIDIMAQDDVSETVSDMRHQVIDELVARHIPEHAYAEQWDTEGLTVAAKEIFGLDLPVNDWAAEEGIAEEEIKERLHKETNEKALANARTIGESVVSEADGARGFLGFIASEPQLAAGLQAENPDFAGIGRTLLSLNRPELQFSGEVDPGKLGNDELQEIGATFWHQHRGAEEVISQFDALEDKSPEAIGAARLKHIEKAVLLHTLDHLWREHIVSLEHLRQVIGFRAYGQRDPLNEYKSEAFLLFEGLLSKLRETVTGHLMRMDRPPSVDDEMMQPEVDLSEIEAHHIDATTGVDEFELADAAIAAEQAGRPLREPRRMPLQTRKAVVGAVLDPNDPSTWGKVSRNAACPCGSGQKYKRCHGKHD